LKHTSASIASALLAWVKIKAFGQHEAADDAGNESD
jgi:hypothetical protein